MPARIPSELARVISRCLRKEPARRYRTMADLTVALEDLREESLSPLQPPQRRRWAWGALAVLVVAGLHLAGVAPPENQEPLRAVPLTTLPVH